MTSTRHHRAENVDLDGRPMIGEEALCPMTVRRAPTAPLGTRIAATPPMKPPMTHDIDTPRREGGGDQHGRPPPSNLATTPKSP